jgi:hypothetical protein
LDCDKTKTRKLDNIENHFGLFPAEKACYMAYRRGGIRHIEVKVAKLVYFNITTGPK